MALWLKLINDATGDRHIGHYDVQIGINHEVLKEFRVENFNRDAGYQALLELAVEIMKNDHPKDS